MKNKDTNADYQKVVRIGDQKRETRNYRQNHFFYSWGEGASLALVGHPSNDGVTIKMPYGVDVLHRPPSHPIFSYWVG